VAAEVVPWPVGGRERRRAGRGRSRRLLLILKPWAPSLSLVPNSDGVSLTQYCATLTPQGAQGAQGFVIDQTNCVQKIDLDKACITRTRPSELKAEFTSPDPQSAICVNPKTGVKFIQGITKMGAVLRDPGPDGRRHRDVPQPPTTRNTWICQVKINMNLACDELYTGPAWWPARTAAVTGTATSSGARSAAYSCLRVTVCYQC